MNSANAMKDKLAKQERFKKALASCKNVEEFFKVCGDFYDLKGAELGMITKPLLINNIDKIIIMTGAKLK